MKKIETGQKFQKKEREKEKGGEKRVGWIK